MGKDDRWFGSILNPKPLGHGSRDLYCVDSDSGAGWEDKPTHTFAGFMCAADGHMEDPCPGNDHGGWTDMAEMARAMADAMENPGCDIRSILEKIEANP